MSLPPVPLWALLGAGCNPVLRGLCLSLPFPICTAPHMTAASDTGVGRLEKDVHSRMIAGHTPEAGGGRAPSSPELSWRCERSIHLSHVLLTRLILGKFYSLLPLHGGGLWDFPCLVLYPSSPNKSTYPCEIFCVSSADSDLLLPFPEHSLYWG